MSNAPRPPPHVIRGSAALDLEEATRHSDPGPPLSRDGLSSDLRRVISTRSSVSHWSPEPGFEHIDGEIGGTTGLNETKVDIIAVPCVGASPTETWSRDPLPKDDYFGVPEGIGLDKKPALETLTGNMSFKPAIDHRLQRAHHTWIRHGIRKEVSMARVLLYRHRELYEGLTLDKMADDLIAHICEIRGDRRASRPLFFICHSIGGLVVKLALTKASKQENLRWMIFDCYGMTFFATPHHGSSYMSMPNLRESIEHLLYLSKPLPLSITEELRIRHKSLEKIHDDFMEIASEMYIWTFYETVDSQLSGLGGSDFDEVHFSAPITSIKSGLLRSRCEQALSVESDHAHCASFGPQNTRIMEAYLVDLGEAVRRAEQLSSGSEHHPLRLIHNVKMELVGFYEDPDPESTSDIRLYISRHYLHEFLTKGPEQCLRERLSSVAAKPHRAVTSPALPRLSPTSSKAVAAGLGVWNDLQGLGQRIFNRSRSSSPGPEQGGRPKIVVSQAVGGSAPNSPLATSSRRSRGLSAPQVPTALAQRPSSRGSAQTDSDETAKTLAQRPGDDDDDDGSPETTDPAALHDMISQAEALGIDEQDFHHAVGSRRIRHIEPARPLFHDWTAGFSRPDTNRRKFMWIHVPFNNPQWVKRIFETLERTQSLNYSKLLSSEAWVGRHIQGRHAQIHAAYVKCGCGFVPAKAETPKPPAPNPGGRSISPSVSPAHLYLYLPYLHFDTYLNIIRRRKIVQRRVAQGRTRPVPKDVAELESVELRVTWEFLGHEPPLNMRRTLDQYGFPSLRETYARDDDQMLYKLTKEQPDPTYGSPGTTFITSAGSEKDASSTSPKSPVRKFMSLGRATNRDEDIIVDDDEDAEIEKEVLNGNVLMVDQLWLWSIDNTTLATFFPKRESLPTEGPMFQQADLRNSVYNELNGDLTGRCENSLDLAAFVVLHAVTVLLDRTSHPDLEIFRIFDESVGVLTERMTSSLKRFRMQTWRDRIHEDADSDDPDENNTKAIKERHKLELEQSERENRENTSALLELRDLDDELNTLKILFDEQTACIKQMKEYYEKPDVRAQTQNGRQYLSEALGKLEEYKTRTKDMMSRIDSTRTDYEKLLEMVQRQAQVDEVRWSRLQTELASSQNLSVMIFTTFTVIFLPLSFFTSLFGMNTAEWGGADSLFPSIGFIGAIALPSSAGVVIIALVAAFSSRAQHLVRSVFRHSAQGVDYARRHLGRLQPKVAKRARMERLRAREQREELRRRRKERGYDFWEAVRTERRSGYRIPELNRKGPIRSVVTKRGTWRSTGSDSTR